MAAGYPILLDITRKTALVVGGGGVAVRKVKGLLAGGAGRVRVVGLEIDEQMPQPPAVERIVGAYEPGLLEGVSLVFAATNNPRVNQQVVTDAQARGLWVNRADSEEEAARDAAAGDFAVPAVYRDGDLIVAVSTGSSPALAAKARDALAAAADPRWAKMAEAMRLLRPRIRAIPDPAVRRRMLKSAGEEEALTVLAQEGIDALEKWLRAR